MNCYNLYSFTLTDNLFSFLVNCIFNSKLSLTFFFFFEILFNSVPRTSKISKGQQKHTLIEIF